MAKNDKKRRLKVMTTITIALLIAFSVIPMSILAMDEVTSNIGGDNNTEVMNDADVTKVQEVTSDSNVKNDTDAITDQNDSVALEEDDNIASNENALRSGNPAEEKAITLIKEGVVVDNFDTLNQTINKMYELTKDGSTFKFVVQVNKDIELSEYSQFGRPYGDVTLRSKDSTNPRTIKANVQNHEMMLGVVNGANLTVENITIDGNNQKRLFWVESTEALPASLTINDGAILQNGKVEESFNTKYGAAIYAQTASSVTINGGIIRNNEGLRNGGAICYIGTGSLTINGGEITGNTAGFGGAIYLQRKAIINGGKIYKNNAESGDGSTFVQT